MNSQIHVNRVAGGWEVRLEHRSVSTFLHEACALEAAWDLARRLGTWIVIRAEEADGGCAERVVQSTFIPRPRRSAPPDGPPTR